MNMMRTRLQYLVGRQESMDTYFSPLHDDPRRPHAGMRASSPCTESRRVVLTVRARPTMPPRHTTYPVYPKPGPPTPPVEDWTRGYAHYGVGVPLSPTYSSSSGQTYSSGPTFSSASSESSRPPAHWAMAVFDGCHAMTTFRGTGIS